VTLAAIVDLGRRFGLRNSEQLGTEMMMADARMALLELIE